MSPNDWKNGTMWFQGHIDNWLDRSGLTIVKLPEEGRDPPTIFIFRSGRLAQSHQSQSFRMAQSHQSQSFRILQYERQLLLDYARHHISLHNNERNIKHMFPMTECFRDEWGNEVVPVQLRILIKELGGHVGHNAALLGWSDLYCVTKEGRLPPRAQCDYFARPV